MSTQEENREYDVIILFRHIGPTINRTQEGTSHKFTYTRSVLESVASSSEAVG